MQMKPNEYKKTIKMGNAIPYEVTVILTDDVNNSRSGRSHFLGPWRELPNTGAVHSGMENEGRSFIFLPHEFRIDYIVHESYHCIVRILEYVGASHEEEIVAYFLGYLVSEIAIFTEKTLQRRESESRAAAVNHKPGTAKAKAK